jgi:methylenetetrahydrofolate reductase (NADPH)
MDGWSIEATLPRPAEIAALADRVRPGTEVFLSTLPHVSLDQQIETARAVRAAGLEPVLHVAARYFASQTELVGYLARASREARVDRILAIAGDSDRPRGPFDSALSLIECEALADYGVRRVGIAGYPEGHPKIPATALAAALDAKLAALAAAALDAQIVTQFSFAAAPVVRWIGETRERWPGVPLRIGLAGPASAPTLLKFAARCGVVGPLGGLGQKLSTARRLVRAVSPEPIITALSQALPVGCDADIAVHLFSFGGLQRTVEWVSETWPDCLPAAAEP